ncbi:MAG: UDP-3-O-(3-hydroxymyristoyl)glucosamine N-acyltransferase [Burkholderiaceae bacterium]
MTHTLGSIVAALGGRLEGDDIVVERLSPIETASKGSLAFVSNPRFARLLQKTEASALILPPSLASEAEHVAGRILVDDVYHYFARLTQFWKRTSPTYSSRVGIHPSAVISPSARIGEGVSIGPLSVIDDHAVIGDHSELGSHVVIGANVRLGSSSVLHPRVTIEPGCVVGDRCIIHSGAVIGADGFGFAPHNGTWTKIEQLGAVRIGNDVEIGANTCVDRGALDDTVIGNGVKLDNLVQIGHNVKVGDHTAMAGCAGVAGSAVIGAHCTIGGGAVVLGHLTLADQVHISASSVVTRSVLKPGHYSGVFPLDENASWEKNAATLKQLYALRDRIKRLEK